MLLTGWEDTNVMLVTFQWKNCEKKIIFRVTINILAFVFYNWGSTKHADKEVLTKTMLLQLTGGMQKSLMIKRNLSFSENYSKWSW